MTQPTQRQRNASKAEKRAAAAVASRTDRKTKSVDKKRPAQTPVAEMSDAEFNGKRAAGNKRARAAEAAAAAAAEVPLCSSVCLEEQQCQRY